MLRSSRAILLALLAIELFTPCAISATWREMFSTGGGDGSRVTPPIRVDTDQWRVSCWVQRRERSDWGFLRIVVKDSATGQPVRVIVATNADLPERPAGTMSAEQSRKATFISRASLSGRGTYLCEVFGTGVQWRLRMEAPGGSLADEPQLLRSEEDLRASSLETSWFALKAITADLLPQESNLSVEHNDWRIRYCVQPKGGEQPPLFILSLRNTQTGEEKVVATVPPSKLLALPEGERQVVGASYLHEPGTFEWKVQAVNVNWAATMEAPTQVSGVTAVQPGRTAPAAPGDWPLEEPVTEEKPAERTGWDDWQSIQEGLKGFEQDEP